MPETAREEAEKALADWDQEWGFAGEVPDHPVIAALRALLSVPETENWEYAWRDEQGHAWPYGARDTEDGASLDEVKWAAEQDWWDEPAATIHRRHPAIPAGPWEPVPVEEDNRG